MVLLRKTPLYIITGASCAGKSTICQILMEHETDYIVMESDILWRNEFNTPENNYREYRELWLDVCAHISQDGLPVILCGCAVPEQFEACDNRNLFSDIAYLAVVCDEAELESRIRAGRGVTDEGWIGSSLQFNGWLIANAQHTQPPITLLDTTRLTPREAADAAHEWIIAHSTKKRS